MQKFEIEMGIPVPDGYRAVGYRLAKKGEFVLRTEGPAIASMDYAQPWIVLEQVELKDINEVRGASLKKLEQEVSKLRVQVDNINNCIDDFAQRIHALEQPFKPKQIDRPTVYYVRNKTTGNFLRRVDQRDRNTLFVTEDQALAEHMAQGTEGGPYEVYPVTLWR